MIDSKNLEAVGPIFSCMRIVVLLLCGWLAALFLFFIIFLVLGISVRSAGVEFALSSWKFRLIALFSLLPALGGGYFFALKIRPWIYRLSKAKFSVLLVLVIVLFLLTFPSTFTYQLASP